MTSQLFLEVVIQASEERIPVFSTDVLACSIVRQFLLKFYELQQLYSRNNSYKIGHITSNHKIVLVLRYDRQNSQYFGYKFYQITGNEGLVSLD